MKHRVYKLIFTLMVLTLFSSSSYAENKSPAYLSFAGGHAAVLDSDQNDLAVFKIEYQTTKRLKWDLIPSFGFAYAESNASFVFTSLNKEYFLSDNWILTPSFGLGIFNDGERIQLGNDLQFRSGLKIYYQLKNKARLGLELYHLSNGGLSDKNPGTEPVFLSISIPF